MTFPRRPPRLVVQTREIDPVDDLLAFTDPASPLAWLRRGEGIVGIGSVGGYQAGGAGRPDPGDDARISPADWWRAVSAEADIDDPVGLHGTGLVAFGTLVFDQRSAASSRLIIPQAIIGRRDGRSWLTRIRSTVADLEEPAVEPVPYGPYWSATLGPGELNPEGYQAAVRAGLDAIAAGEVGKVVLARDLVGTVPAGADLRRLVRALSRDYLDTWTFAVDGLIGASPETLVTVSGGDVTARVLAGTFPRGADSDDDAAASFRLSHSGKDLDEHQYAVRSVLDALAPHTGTLRADDEPFALELPNLWHLATDVAGEIADHASALDLVAALHPTAAVAGTPTDAAIEVIRRIEPFDRRRYAGPVGWVDAAGDGEWAIALRCAQIGAEPSHRFAEYSDTIPVVAHAGAGIVAGSDPETELLETRVKFRPIVDALA
ncbi:isochorismate synthase [Microbacterium sp. Root166]|uniref:isochorismate synthase n=1 Tax=Microbacterium sp. Root166 TaxID=1736478 RepID=UPI0006F6E781|nr:chorismate-binding protein [Microbacterium sp. Root166]KQZ85000.1 isochorismate synthase [Microbacterium sp. Root166]